MNRQNGMQDLRRLSRRDLLELLVQQNRKIDQLTERLDLANKKLEDRIMVMYETGSIAEASLRVNEVFEAAQRACDQYTANVMKRNEALEVETRKKCDRMIEEARAQIERMQKTKEG